MTTTTRRPLAAALALVAGLVGVAVAPPVTASAEPGVVAAPAATAPAATASVATGRLATVNMAEFDPGYLISDSIFYASSSMDAAAIQSFLEIRNPTCRAGADGTPCLKDFRQDTWTRAATTRCPGTYVGAPGERASDIIAKVAQACGINPRVILVTLQKEQSLVTATGSALYATRYRSAMGYGCPDSAACDSQYYGFFNQVYSAASQFKNYALNPTRYAHRAGAVNNVRYHPNINCGSSPVLIRNQATASLYNYTPYQPNAAALAAGTGTGDACSSYGNRNFWYYFNLWFGRTTGNSPIGFFDVAAPGDLAVSVAGWTFDPDTNGTISVRVTVDGVPTVFAADSPRPDVDAVYHTGVNHGYTRLIPAAAGSRTVCVQAIDHDGTAPAGDFGCRTVVVPARPTGFFDALTSTPTSITASGWAVDPDTTAPIQVRMTVDGTPQTVLADASRPDVGRFTGLGDNHGFSVTLPAAEGTHTVCIDALKAAPSRDVALGCRTVRVTNNPPIGRLDTATATASTITVTGWAVDPDATAPVQAQVIVDGVPTAITADASRPDVGRATGLGDNHGFVATVGAALGDHNVCVRALDTTSGAAVDLGCRVVTVVNSVPMGRLDVVSSTATTITVAGWALDVDTTDPIPVHVYVDGVPNLVTANASRPDVGRATGRGDNHGYSLTLPVAEGTHTVCVYAINTPAGANPQLGCRTVTTRNATPVGFLDVVSATATTITAAGWAVDPDTTDPITVHVYVDGVPQAFTANTSRPDVGRATGLGDNHGYVATTAATPGPHTVCVYAINATPGANPQLGCRSVTVR